MNIQSRQATSPYRSFPDKIFQAAWAVHQKTQAPLSMALTLALGVTSEAVQALASVQIPEGPHCLLSNWVLIIADSGEGKSPVMNMLRKPITIFEEQQYQAYQTAMEQYRVAQQTWKLAKDEYEKAYRKAVREQVCMERYENQLSEHMKREPRRPRQLKLTYPDATPEAFLRGLSENWPHASLVSDEASVFLNGHMANGLAELNQRWDPQPLSISRASWDKPLYVQDPRVMLLWAIQPGPLAKYLARRGNEARELGTTARFLVCQPDSQQGQRNVFPREINMEGLTVFHHRITELLKASMTADGEPNTEKQTLTFSPEAAIRYHRFRQEVEEELGEGGSLERVKDYGAKLARHAARIAGVFEFFETGSHVIHLETLERAIEVMIWFAKEYIRVFVPPPEPPQEEQDADTLLPWLEKFAKRKNNRYLVQNEVLRKVTPAYLRNTLRLQRALHVLELRQKLSVNEYQFRMMVIDLEPHLWESRYFLNRALDEYRNSRRKNKIPFHQLTFRQNP